jgi:hypothetical protein
MKVFGDAVYFVALLSARDRWHAHARAINQNPPGPLVTTEWILTEVGDAFSQPAAGKDFSMVSVCARTMRKALFKTSSPCNVLKSRTISLM